MSRYGSSGWDTFKAILACILVFVAVVGFMVLKMEAYGGRPECLFIRCVKVIP